MTLCLTASFDWRRLVKVRGRFYIERRIYFMMMIEERRAVMYRLTFDMVAWNEDTDRATRAASSRSKMPSPRRMLQSTPCRQAISTHNDVRHAVYRADIGYVDFCLGARGRAAFCIWPANGSQGHRAHH